MKKWHILILLSWVAFWVTVNIWPTSFWADIRQIQAFNTDRGELVVLTIDGTINRDFEAEWRVGFRPALSQNWIKACHPEVVNTLPARLHVGVLVDGKCLPLPQGQYVIRASWFLEGGLLPDKLISGSSNIFSVGEIR